MKENFDACLELLLKDEGGWVNDPRDSGGETKYGVTKKVYEEWVGHPVDTLKNITIVDVTPIYKTKYWDKNKCDDLPIGIDYAVFDFSVNAGVGRSAKLLQQVLNIVVDGAIGNQTLQAIKKASATEVIDAFSQAKTEFYKSLPTFPTFGRGWLSRVDRAKQSALAMIDGHTLPKSA